MRAEHLRILEEASSSTGESIETLLRVWNAEAPHFIAGSERYSLYHRFEDGRCVYCNRPEDYVPEGSCAPTS